MKRTTKKDTFWIIAFSLMLIAYIILAFTDHRAFEKNDLMFCGLLGLGLVARIWHRIKVKKIIKMEFDDEELLESEEDDEDKEDPYLTETSEDIPEEIDESLSDDEE